jgi:hypothetical protein
VIQREPFRNNVVIPDEFVGMERILELEKYLGSNPCGLDAPRP